MHHRAMCWLPLILSVASCTPKNTLNVGDVVPPDTVARPPTPPDGGKSAHSTPSLVPGTKETTPAIKVNTPAKVNLPLEQLAALLAWYRDLGERREGEEFGKLVVRAALIQLGKPYDNTPQSGEPEVLRIDLTQFQCVSLVESSLAVAACVWQNQPNEACFVREIESQRYRDGKMERFASRLHYTPDWLHDNERRGRLTSLTAELGGKPVSHQFNFMTQHPRYYPALAAKDVANEVRATEERLSASAHVVLSREMVPNAEPHLHDGDVVGVVSNRKPGLLVGHIGFIDVSDKGVPRLLHASSHHKRVLLNSSSISSYLARRPYRIGLMVARPLPPLPVPPGGSDRAD